MPQEYETIKAVFQHIREYAYWYLGGFVLFVSSAIYSSAKLCRHMDMELEESIKRRNKELVDIIATNINMNPEELNTENALEIAGYLMDGVQHPNEVTDELREPYKDYVHTIIDDTTFKHYERREDKWQWFLA